mgnify:CR=1 FL=1
MGMLIDMVPASGKIKAHKGVAWLEKRHSERTVGVKSAERASEAKTLELLK